MVLGSDPCVDYGHEFYGEYSIEVAKPAKDGTPMVRVNGGRPCRVFAHSDGTYRTGPIRKVEAACLVYAPGYQRRYECDNVSISADPQFLVN